MPHETPNPALGRLNALVGESGRFRPLSTVSRWAVGGRLLNGCKERVPRSTRGFRPALHERFQRQRHHHRCEMGEFARRLELNPTST
jgi:hypothetical protein